MEQDNNTVVTEVIRLLQDDMEQFVLNYPTPDRLASHLEYEHPANLLLLKKMENLKGVPYSATKVRSAIERRHVADVMAQKKATMERMREEADKEAVQKIIDRLGGTPTTEREYIELFAAKMGLRMKWDRTMYAGASDKKLRLIDVRTDAHLTASDLSMVRPRGDLLSSSGIDKAMDEWISRKRDARFDDVWDNISILPRNKDRKALLEQFKVICGYYFAPGEGDYAAAAIVKFIWSVKRRMRRLHVEYRQMVVLLGTQGSGKGAFIGFLTDPVDEISGGANLVDVLDARQMDLPACYVLRVDEMAYAEKADVASLKSFITSDGRSSRPMGSNIAVKSEVNATLIGTSNRTLAEVIRDSTGMRRFIEIEVRNREDIEAHWQEIKNFDWLGLWQAVDETDDTDPLMTTFGDKVKERIEELRTQEATEQWFRQFNEEDSHYGAVIVRQNGTEYWQWRGNELFLMFSAWEEQYCGTRNKTTVTRWGRQIKALIADKRNEVFDGWEYFTQGYSIYRKIAKSKVVEINKSRPSLNDMGRKHTDVGE